MDLSFGEQVKILLKRRNMTIKDLAAILEEQTGKPTSRQNLTQKLGRNNFQEQDMREIARALNCGLFIQMIPLSDLRPITPVTAVPVVDVADSALPSVEAILAAAQLPTSAAPPAKPAERRAEATPSPVSEPSAPAAKSPAEPEEPSYYIEKEEPDREVLTKQISALLNPLMHAERKKRPERNPARLSPIPATPAAQQAEAEKEMQPDVSALPASINPLTGEEYLNNTVRPCPDRPGYIEVYDRSEHAWVETNESEFQRFQQQKRLLLGADYEPPIYI